MADLHIVRKHALGLQEARKIAFNWAEQVENDLGMSCTYEEGRSADKVCFSRSGVQGELQVTKDTFELDAKLGFLVGAFKGRIEAEITEMLNQLLPEPSAAAAKKAAGKPAAAKKSRDPEMTVAAGPLAGLRVLELGQLIAGPFAAKTLADFGADVIKVEAPADASGKGGKGGTGGDPLRRWRLLKNGTSVWWQVQSRNKRSVTLDLRQREAQDIVRTLAQQADVLIENFRPGAMEGWGMGPEVLQAANPALIMLRISGYGQTGPYRDRPGFGVVAEAMGGLRHLTGEPGRVPVRVGISIGDTLASLHGVIGILMALQHRHASTSAEYPKGLGQVIDVALYEAVFNCMESLLPEYSVFGAVREPSGSALPGIAPTNAYQCADGAWAIIAGNGDSIFKRLMHTIGRDDLGQDPALADNAGRVVRVDEIDAAIGAWAATLPGGAVLQALEQASVPAGRIYTIADIAADPHYAARGMLSSVTLDDGTQVAVPGFVPKMSRTPGSHRRNAPALGQDTEAVLREVGITDAQLQALRERGVIGA